MELIMPGTGNALVTECYNTCFILKDQKNCFMIDAGEGNTILHQLKKAGIDWRNVREIFVTHKHIDHILGIIWMIRMICQHMQEGSYDGDAVIYSHEEVISILYKMACELAETFHIENLLLYHTEDKHLKDRKKLYLAEGNQFYHGNLFIPDDLEIISLF